MDMSSAWIYPDGWSVPPSGVPGRRSYRTAALRAWMPRRWVCRTPPMASGFQANLSSPRRLRRRRLITNTDWGDHIMFLILRNTILFVATMLIAHAFAVAADTP